MGVPKLRFAGFSGHYETKTMMDVCKINQGLQIPIAERLTTPSDNCHFYITNEFLKENSSKKYYIENAASSVMCDENDLLMTRTGNTGTVVKNVRGVFHNNFFKIKYNDLVQKDFLYYFLLLEKTQRLILKLAGTSTIPDLNHGDFYRIEISLPTISEQIKIAQCLIAIDEKISLLNKKYELLSQYKKGMMQKVFSQELQFKDESGEVFPAWQEIRLSNLGNTYNGLTGKTAEDFGKGAFYITYKQIFDNRVIHPKYFGLVNISKNEKQNKVEYGDLFFTTSSETPDEVAFCSVFLGTELSDCYLNSFCFGYRLKNINKNDPVFLSFLFRSDYFRAKVKTLAQGSTRFNISKTQFMMLSVNIPVTKEQTKIANFLSALDNKIAVKKAELDKLKTWKQGLLQQMFV